MNIEKCKICTNYLHGIERCKYCVFEYDDDLPWTNDIEWDIFEIDDDVEWSFLQIQYRLKSKGIDCTMVLNWLNNNILVILGTKSYHSKIARALGVHEDTITSDSEYGIVIVNLFHEKYIRGLLNEDNGDLEQNK